MVVGVPLAGTHHVALSVTDLDASRAWYKQDLDGIALALFWERA